jgi:hypothetical protein
MGVLQLSGLGLLTFFIKGRVNSTEVREEGGEGQSREHLGHSRLKHVIVLVPAPVASGEGSPHSSGDVLGPEVGGESLDSVLKVSSLVVDVLLNVVLHVGDHLSELLAEHVAKEGACHVQTFFAVVITIVFSGSVEEGGD